MVKKIIDSIFPISRQSLQEIESLLTLEYIVKGETFIRENKRNGHEYFLLDGVCKSYVFNPEGDEISISFFTANSILSPYTTRTREGISVLNFKALTDLKIAKIDASEFEKRMVSNLEIRNFGNAVLRKELAEKVAKEIGLASMTAKQRLIDFRKQFPMLENLIPHPDIASYLGITNISLSRIRGELAK
jgi:CRP-like cAMP-binding protein